MAARRTCRSGDGPPRARVGRSMVSGTDARLALAAALGQVVAWRFTAGGAGGTRLAGPCSPRAKECSRSAARRRAAWPVTALVRDDLRGSRGRRLGIGLASLSASLRRDPRSTRGGAMTIIKSERESGCADALERRPRRDLRRLRRQDVLGPDHRSRPLRPLRRLVRGRAGRDEDRPDDRRRQPRHR